MKFVTDQRTRRTTGPQISVSTQLKDNKVDVWLNRYCWSAIFIQSILTVLGEDWKKTNSNFPLRLRTKKSTKKEEIEANHNHNNNKKEKATYTRPLLI